MMRTGTRFVLECRVYDGLVLGLYWTVQFTEDLYWFCSGLWVRRKIGIWIVMDCGIYGRPVHGQ